MSKNCQTSPPPLKIFLKHVETFSSLVEGVSKYVVTYSKNILDVPITHFSQYAKKSIFLGVFWPFLGFAAPPNLKLTHLYGIVPAW